MKTRYGSDTARSAIVSQWGHKIREERIGRTTAIGKKW